MHLCIQDYQIGRKFKGLTPAGMDSLTHLINTEKVFSSKQPSPSAGTTPTLNLPCFTRESVHSPSSLNYSDFYGLEVHYIYILHCYALSRKWRKKVDTTWPQRRISSAYTNKSGICATIGRWRGTFKFVRMNVRSV
jgi:hypothetical protein